MQIIQNYQKVDQSLNYRGTKTSCFSEMGSSCTKVRVHNESQLKKKNWANSGNEKYSDASYRDRENSKSRQKSASNVDDISARYDMKDDSDNFDRKIFIFFIGGPGSGKEDQCKLIVKEFHTGYIKVGDLLKKEAEKGGELGNMIQEKMKEGAIVSQDVIIQLLKDEILEQKRRVYIIDGFPRSIQQAESFENNIKPCTSVLFIDVPDDVLIERLLEKLPSTDNDDDNGSNTIRKRLVSFHDMSDELYSFYSKLEKTTTIDGSREPQQVFEDIQNKIKLIITNS